MLGLVILLNSWALWYCIEMAQEDISKGHKVRTWVHFLGIINLTAVLHSAWQLLS